MPLSPYEVMWLVLIYLLSARAGANEVTPAPLRCRDERCQYLNAFDDQKHRYIVEDNELEVTYRKIKGYFWMNCISSNVSESTAMPRADKELFAWQVRITNCQLPTNSSIVDKLNWLNITMLFNETEEISTNGILVLNKLPPSSLFTTKHFDGLENLVKLEISSEDSLVNAEANFLAPMKSLRQLKIQRVKLADGELNTPRPTLKELHLIHTGVERLSEAIYASSSILNLTVDSDVSFDAVAVPPKLRWLELKSPATTLQLVSVLALEKLHIANWTETQPLVFKSCENLKKLYLTSPAVITLPYHWVANCSMLRELVIEKALNLTTLPRRLFGVPAPDDIGINLVAFKEGVLETLNEGQFDIPDNKPSPVLELHLNGNRLRKIPNSTITPGMSVIDLSSNDLDSSVLDLMVQVKILAQLNLSNNPRFGDACPENGHSLLRSHTLIRMLRLANTSITRICRDWRESLQNLDLLDLRNTSVATLKFRDIRFWRNVWSEVLLQGAPVTMLEMTSNDYKKAKNAQFSDASIILDASARFQCDCRMYWTRRVLESFPHVLKRISELRCSDGQLLSNKMPEELVCPRHECAATAQTAPAANNCTCAERPDDDPARDTQLLRVNCTGAALHQVPRFPPSDNRLYELLLADNQITDVHASDLDNVKTLDLRNNFITKVDNETAVRLGSIDGILWLAGNRLDCDCSATPLLQALHSRGNKYTDLDNVSCSDGTPLSEAPIGDCSPSVAGYVGGLAALFTVAVAVIACLASRERRFFVKAVLVRWGCRCWLNADEDDRRYDAFITYSHKDEDIVRELVARLEPPYRLCLHQRDWVPGLRIPDQIVASVRESRRTVALVSKHFLASSWARAEFREAHEVAISEAKPRLVVILLEDPAELELDEQLQRYIATHTYLRWGDPWFYHKLAVTLPRPRTPQSVTAPDPLVSTPEPSHLYEHPSSPEEVIIPLSVIR